MARAAQFRRRGMTAAGRRVAISHRPVISSRRLYRLSQNAASFISLGASFRPIDAARVTLRDFEGRRPAKMSRRSRPAAFHQPAVAGAWLNTARFILIVGALACAESRLA